MSGGGVCPDAGASDSGCMRVAAAAAHIVLLVAIRKAAAPRRLAYRFEGVAAALSTLACFMCGQTTDRQTDRPRTDSKCAAAVDDSSQNYDNAQLQQRTQTGN